MSESESPGWDAIDRVVKGVYNDQEPKHYATAIPYKLGGPDPLPGVSIYENSTDGVDWWHFVTYGLTELFEKETDDHKVSGFGFELTFRLVKKPNESEPPHWAINFLQNLARYVFETGITFDVGDHMDANGPIAVEEETDITAIAITEDDLFPGVARSPNGEFQFLQIVGMTRDERTAALGWNTEGFLKAMRDLNPALLTDISRDSFMKNEAFAMTVQEGADRDGSATGVIYGDQLAYETLDDGGFVVTLGALSIDSLTTVLPRRIPFGGVLGVYGDEVNVAFAPTTWNGHDDEAEYILITDVDAKRVTEILRPIAGEYTVSDQLRFKIVPTDITDNEGNVVRTIG